MKQEICNSIISRSSTTRHGNLKYLLVFRYVNIYYVILSYHLSVFFSVKFSPQIDICDAYMCLETGNLCQHS